MYCGKCGKTVKDGARFCVYCGELIDQIDQKTIENASYISDENERYTIANRKRKINIHLLILPILIFIVIIFICVVGYNKSKVKGKYYEIFEGKYTGNYVDFKSNGIAEDNDGHKFLYRQNGDIVEIWEASYDEEIIYYECIKGVLYCMEYPEKTLHPEDLIDVLENNDYEQEEENNVLGPQINESNERSGNIINTQSEEEDDVLDTQINESCEQEGDIVNNQSEAVYNFTEPIREKYAPFLDNYSVYNTNKGTLATGVNSYRNIVIFGVNSDSGRLTKNTRSNAIMVLSIDETTNQIKIMGIHNDTFLCIGENKYDKAQRGYIDGPKQGMEMLNANLDLNIADFITIGFEGLIELIDGVGGVWVYVDEEELESMHPDIVTSIPEEIDNMFKPLENTGYQILDGVQAVKYCMGHLYLASAGYEEIARQQEVMVSIVDQLQYMDATAKNNLCDKLYDVIYTSMQQEEILGVFNGTITGVEGFPKETISEELSIGSKGICICPTSLEENVEWFHEFMFNSEDYQASSKVKELSREIECEIEPYVNSEIKGVGSADRIVDLLSQTDYILSNGNTTSRNITIGSTSDDFIKAYNNCVTTVLYFDEDSEIAEEVDCEKIDYSRNCAVFLPTFFIDGKAINVEEFKEENNIDSGYLGDWLKTNKQYLKKHQVVYKCIRFAFEEGEVCDIWLFEVPYNE